jgi:hypothetical protein
MATFTAFQKLPERECLTYRGFSMGGATDRDSIPANYPSSSNPNNPSDETATPVLPTFRKNRERWGSHFRFGANYNRKRISLVAANPICS